MQTPSVPFGKDVIESILPHRDPFLLVDEVAELEPGRRVLARRSVNADDWWFHTAARGNMPWLGYGFDATWSLRLAAFFETRDGLSEKTERVLLDVAARW